MNEKIESLALTCMPLDDSGDKGLPTRLAAILHLLSKNGLHHVSRLIEELLETRGNQDQLEELQEEVEGLTSQLVDLEFEKEALESELYEKNYARDHLFEKYAAFRSECREKLGSIICHESELEALEQLFHELLD